MRYTFKLETDEPRPVRTGSGISGIQHLFYDFVVNPHLPYIQKIDAGAIEYNTLPTTSLGKAIDTGDEEYQQALLTLYTTQGFIEYTTRELSMEEGMPLALELQHQIYTTIFQNFRQLRQERKRRKATASRRRK